MGDVNTQKSTFFLELHPIHTYLNTSVKVVKVNCFLNL